MAPCGQLVQGRGFFFFFSFAISRQVGGIYLGYKSGWLSKLHFLSTQLVSKPKGSLFQLSATLSLNLGLGATTSMVCISSCMWLKKRG
ncbi:hypothetical protein F5Y02DRAFT_157603 [Annulohypoxylon stygium]|nr:hypothetical protein F5Y02DRAFT_157603 [Annulohypoxylon stygium]